MKIKRIQVKNIGPYVNENAFDFDVSDITKRMVLIGGKNGAGKTTLFNAIKICLYGCVAYGFESNNAKYFAEIEKIINANVLMLYLRSGFRTSSIEQTVAINLCVICSAP